MYDTLHDELQKRGWQPGTYRGFLRQVRGGLEWEVGRGRSGRMELRWRYKELAGEEALLENAGRAELEDVMTGIYLRIHEKPDPTRVFGGGKKATKTNIAAPVSVGAVAVPAEADAGQGTMDL